MKKKLVAALKLIMLGILLVVLIKQCDYFYYNSDEIFSNKEDGTKGLVLKLKHHFIERRSTTKFASSEKIDVIYKQVAKQYDKVIRGENNECIYIFADEVYILSLDEKVNALFGKRYIYYIHEARICLYDYQSNDYVDIPFPYEELIPLSITMNNEMEIRCDFEYLKEFYQYVEGARIYDDVIEVDAVNAADKYFRITSKGNHMILFEVLKRQ